MTTTTPTTKKTYIVLANSNHKQLHFLGGGGGGVGGGVVLFLSLSVSYAASAHVLATDHQGGAGHAPRKAKYHVHYWRDIVIVNRVVLICHRSVYTQTFSS